MVSALAISQPSERGQHGIDYNPVMKAAVERCILRGQKPFRRGSVTWEQGWGSQETIPSRKCDQCKGTDVCSIWEELEGVEKLMKQNF